MPKRTLVTGGAGFLGSHLCERLIADGYEVICVDNFYTGRRTNIEHLLGHPRFELIRQDVIDPLTFEVEEIYHLACPASPVHYQKNPVRTIRTAVEGTLNVLELAHEVGARVLIASTSEVYGDPEVHPQQEGYWGHVNPIGPRACYDEGKRCGEALAMAYANQYSTEVRIARIFNTYGPRLHEDDGRVVSNLVVQALRGDPLTVYGDGSQTRSFCYVTDLVEGFVRLMASDHGPSPVNLGNPRETTVLELANIVKRLTRAAAPIAFAPLPKDDPCRRNPNISRAQELLGGWAPRVELEDGLKKTIEDFRQRLGARVARGGVVGVRKAAALARSVGI
jgi:UDP-glucuronate decarboxylase